jgi:hypothetical protein
MVFYQKTAVGNTYSYIFLISLIWHRPYITMLPFRLIFIPPIAPQSSSSIIWGLYNRPEVAAVPRDLVPPHQ